MCVCGGKGGGSNRIFLKYCPNFFGRNVENKEKNSEHVMLQLWVEPEISRIQIKPGFALPSYPCISE
jgi:hypothetical protein